MKLSPHDKDFVILDKLKTDKGEPFPLKPGMVLEGVVTNVAAAHTELLGSLDGRISLRARVEGHDPVAVGVEAARRLVDEQGGRLVLDDELVGRQ